MALTLCIFKIIAHSEISFVTKLKCGSHRVGLISDINSSAGRL